MTSFWQIAPTGDTNFASYEDEVYGQGGALADALDVVAIGGTQALTFPVRNRYFGRAGEPGTSIEGTERNPSGFLTKRDKEPCLPPPAMVRAAASASDQRCSRPRSLNRLYART